MQNFVETPGRSLNERKSLINNVFLGFVILFLSVIYFLGIKSVPFHPDESTQIFMSADVEQFFQDPASLTWQPGVPIDMRMQYRLLDAPLARYWIGIVRSVQEIPPLASDWDWSASWEENLKSGALPSDRQLSSGRLASAIFFPLELLFLYLIGKKINGIRLGWIMLALFSLNALVLLHTRRSMSEGSLLFFMILTLWVFLQNPRYLFLSAVPAAFAFNAKYSAFPVFLLGLFVIVSRYYASKNRVRKIVLQGLSFIVIFTGVTILLNPFLWGYPLEALSAALLARKALLVRQVSDLGAVSQGWISDSPLKRIASMIANLYLTPPAYHDIGNYIDQTRETELAYQSLFVNTFFRGFIWGSFVLILAVYGFVLGFLRWVKRGRCLDHPLSVFVVGTLLQVVFLAMAFSIPFQRYVVSLIPFSTLWIAFSIDEGIRRIKKQAV